MEGSKSVSFRGSAGEGGLPPLAAQPLSAETVKINSAALRAFPTNELRATLKTDDTGKLQQAHTASRTLNRLTGGGPNLVALHTSIQQTFDAVLSPCHEQLQDWDKAKIQGELYRRDAEYKGPVSKSMTHQSIHAVESRVKEAEEMLEGLSRLHNSLDFQYPKEKSPKEQSIVSELQANIRAYSSQIAKDKKLLRKLKEALPPEETAAQPEEDYVVIHEEDIPVVFHEAAAEAPPVVIHTAAPVTVEDAVHDLDSYLSHFGPENVKPAQARGFIQEGRTLLNGILDGSDTNINVYPGGYEKALNALSWQFMSLALEKGQGHGSGSFTIEDPTGRLFAYINQSPAEDRLSTHHKKRRAGVINPSVQRGVDVMTGTTPADKHHLLFGQLKQPLKTGQPLLFFKLEDSNPKGSAIDMIHHAGGAVMSVGRKLAGGAGNEKAGMAKEHVPGAVKKSFKTLLADLQKTDKIPGQEGNIARIHGNMDIRGFRILEGSYGATAGEHFLKINAVDPAQLASTYGIAYMTEFVKEAKLLRAPLDETALANFEQAVNELRLDHLDKRSGKEVYLTEEEVARGIGMHLPEEI